jgi:hypothetical protein
MAKKLFIDYKFKMVEVTRISEKIVDLRVVSITLINKMKKQQSYKIVKRKCEDLLS